ncbi:GNAT family N-acetyltransferase [Treponema sp. OMZ 792]|uniref:GNAT family N-acetyltransferase n=1 Tax=unclassified Treponema TaxID=2638727 RepID=UPI0020A5B5DA|nr:MULTISPECIES: GNAT family N-acetyltransferase [unclassified Treponema]UTC74203.1 GNAT family N-acetyltransferase [Treponema sp. OMZ 792]UTC77513.1 GNAT family N-acetyltransferase [Treponema sp. OMZ 799]UTC80600.1 GNAT family N-acetyltransferase [Treponema sp. OMZ 798]
MILLEKINENSYKLIKQNMIKNLAEALIQTKKAKALTAIDLAEKELNNILTEGIKTKNHNLYIIKNNSQKIGYLWYFIITHNKATFPFVMDINIDEKYKNKGYGKQTMILLEKEIINLGYNKIRLHVLLSNTIAYNMYKHLNYKTIKRIDGGEILEKKLSASFQGDLNMYAHTL